jgi:glycosyltransferase involved in cell wall biosynthesis
MPESRFERSVCTFHDLFVFTSDYSSPEYRARFTLQARSAAARADLFICVSDFTASQLVDLLGVDRSLIRVIPHGAVLPAGPLPETREAIVLHTGAIQHRKNLLRLVAAFERAAPAPWRLVLAGSDGYGAAAIHARIAASPARDRIETPGWIDDAALESLYRRASIFAFPSLDEGFGIPVLEAMAHALPVLASDRSALPEACGDAALLVNPLSEDQIAGALETLITDESLRRRLSDAGRARAALFPWERAAAATWNVYRELLA